MMRNPSVTRLLGSALIACVAAAPAAAQTLYEAVADSYIQSGTEQNTNFGSATLLIVRRNPLHRALIRFDEAEIAADLGDQVVLSATLELFSEASTNWSVPGAELAAHRATRDWTEPAVTWNCAVDLLPGNGQIDCEIPWVGGEFEPLPSGTTVVNNATVGFVPFDVTHDVRAFVAGEPNRGWLIKKVDENANGRVEFASREGGAIRRPRLRVEFASALPTPTPTGTPSEVPTETATPRPTAPPPAQNGSSSGGGGCTVRPGANPTMSLLPALILFLAVPLLPSRRRARRARAAGHTRVGSSFSGSRSKVSIASWTDE